MDQTRAQYQSSIIRPLVLDLLRGSCELLHLKWTLSAEYVSPDDSIFKYRLGYTVVHMVDRINQPGIRDKGQIEGRLVP